MSEEVALMIQNLTKSYGKIRALRGVDLRMPRGEILGFLGPNGAGKTTTITAPARPPPSAACWT